MNTEPDSLGQRIPVIDGLRGYAVLAVVAAHLLWPDFDSWYRRSASLSDYFPTHQTFVINFGLAVSLFFVLSGFVLTLPYFRGQRTMNSVHDYYSYVVRRAKRLLPLYFAGFVFIAFTQMPDASPRETLVHMFQMSTLTFQFFHPSAENEYNPVLWSLEVEWWLSLVLPIFLLAARKWSCNRVVLISIVISLCSALFLTKDIFEVSGYQWFFATNSVFAKVSTFVIGMACAHTYCTYRSSIRPFTALLTGFLFLTAGCVIFELVLMHQFPVISTIIAYTLATLGFSLLLLGLLVHRSRITRLLFENRPIMLCGRICYSIYVWHMTGISAQMPMLNIYRFVRYVFLLFAVSLFSYRYIEYGHEKDYRRLLPDRPKPLETKKQ